MLFHFRWIQTYMCSWRTPQYCYNKHWHHNYRLDLYSRQHLRKKKYGWAADRLTEWQIDWLTTRLREPMIPAKRLSLPLFLLSLCFRLPQRKLQRVLGKRASPHSNKARAEPRIILVRKAGQPATGLAHLISSLRKDIFFVLKKVCSTW